jgi:hypothetical protein
MCPLEELAIQRERGRKMIHDRANAGSVPEIAVRRRT